MGDKEKFTLWWWIKTGGQTLLTTSIAFAPEILQTLPKHTLLFKLALPVGFFLKAMRMKTEYGKDILPSGITKVMDRIPDDITGEKGSLK